MRLPSTVRFADDKVKKEFYKLENGNDSDKELFKFINQAMDNLEDNTFCGIQIPKKLIPKEYIKKYKIKNLWKYDLPRGWRLMYSIVGEEVIIICLILEWFDHKDYERRFRY
ncbi:hypothetical protein AYK26_00450 [Euryarchaeota archaeon SM23-78]|nr:MAG: hypothetical protein AYK26_00450 [Euryarchaeota archaeon SM23-78]MBW3001330.1 hypothetical protein [Candidatus Woesearchaeota archaeon]